MKWYVVNNIAADTPEKAAYLAGYTEATPYEGEDHPRGWRQWYCSGGKTGRTAFASGMWPPKPTLIVEVEAATADDAVAAVLSVLRDEFEKTVAERRAKNWAIKQYARTCPQFSKTGLLIVDDEGYLRLEQDGASVGVLVEEHFAQDGKSHSGSIDFGRARITIELLSDEVESDDE